MTPSKDKPDWALNRRERVDAEHAVKGLPPKKHPLRWLWLVVILALTGGAVWFVQ